MFERVGRFVSQAPEKRSYRIVLLFAIFVVAGTADYLIAWAVITLHLPIAAHGTLDGAVLGAVAVLTAWSLLEAARRERLRIKNELEKDARLNHEVRNALEVIGQAGYLISDLNLKKVLSESVQRIDSILKERTPRQEERD